LTEAIITAATGETKSQQSIPQPLPASTRADSRSKPLKPTVANKQQPTISTIPSSGLANCRWDSYI
ncbi:MAG: hypothetical protein LC687_07840, partial [Actinobacteria bacterium]|nr:hypothetical protein [Actinomycetota bacterium]